MTLAELCTRRVAVWGLGQEGLALTVLLRRRGVAPLLIDDHPDRAAARASDRLGGDVAVTDPASVAWSDIGVVVRAPGVSRYRPELAAARQSGAEVTTAMALWLEDFAEARVVAVTGTKGKSTTAALLAAVLREEGMGVELVGNIGAPVTDTYERPLADAYVVEVSSYQAAEVTVSPAVCVLDQPGARPSRLARRQRGGLLPGQAAPGGGGSARVRWRSTRPATRRCGAPRTTRTGPSSARAEGYGWPRRE